MRHLIINSCFMLASFGLALSSATASAATPNGWFIRLIADAPTDKLQDQANVLGLLSDSVNTYDSHDLEELTPFGTSYLTLVFPHQNWLKPGDYNSDFQALDNQAHQWNFEVRTDNINRNVTLRWQGDTAKLQKSTLKDVKTGQVYNVALTKSLSFVMGAKVRSFVWTVQP